VNNTPPRWRIRRGLSGRWEVYLRTAGGKGTYFYASLGDWPTWADAIAYVHRAQTHNYGVAA
jgi:hypothetical protein